jgi:hypothetical protein
MKIRLVSLVLTGFFPFSQKGKLIRKIQKSLSIARLSAAEIGKCIPMVLLMRSRRNQSIKAQRAPAASAPPRPGGADPWLQSRPTLLDKGRSLN